MKRLISIILILTFIFSLGANMSFVNAADGSAGTNANTFKPTDDPIFWYEQPSVDSDGTPQYDFYPIYNETYQGITDQDFFGKYDATNGVWTKTPYFRYEEFPEMSKIEEAAKAGDYDEAKVQILEYYKANGRQRLPQVTSVPRGLYKSLEAIVRNVYPVLSNGRQEEFIPINYTDQWDWYEVDILSSIGTAKKASNANYVVQLASVDKYYTQIEIMSKDNGNEELAPYLELNVNGNTQYFKVKGDATIISDDQANENFGSEPVLYIEEHGVYQNYTGANKSKRAFVVFDTSGIKSTDTITKAKLHIYARATCPTDPTREIDGYKELSTFYVPTYDWTEDTLKWNDISDFLWFTCNDMENWDFITPSGAGDKGKVMDHLRGTFCVRLTETGIFLNNESYLYNAIRHEMATITSVGSVIVSGNSGWGTGDHVYNSLDRSTHLINSTYYDILLTESKYMTPEIFTSFLKFNWQLANFQQKYYFGISNNNWATYATSSVYHLCARYPEFRQYDEWLTKVKEENLRCFGKNNFEDGMCAESSLSYTSTILDTFETPIKTSFITGVEAPFTEEMKEGMRGIIMTLAYGSGPYGGGFNIGDTHDPYSDYRNTIKKWYTYMFEGDQEMLYYASKGVSGTPPAHPTTYYWDGMRTYFRSDLSQDSLQMSFTNNIKANLTHAHKDALSIAMFAYGKFLLTDQAYSQNLTDTQFNYYMYSPVQHNLVTVNDVGDYLKTGVNSSYDTIDLKQDGYYEHNHEFNSLYDFMEYGTDEYKTSQYIQRSVTFMRNQSFWIISDYAVPTDNSEGTKNLFAQHWHLYPGSNMTNDSETLAVKSNFPDVNVMLVPIEYEELDDLEYVDTKYSEHSAVTQDSKKAMYTKTKEGAGRFTTLIIPINSGESFTVDTSVVDTGISNPDLVNAAYFKIKNDVTGQENYYYYYHINDVSQKPAEGAKLGDFTTDATTAVIQLNTEGTVVSTFLMDATYLKTTSENLSTEYLFMSETAVEGIAYNRNAQYVEINSSSLTADDLENITIYQYGVKNSTLNEAAVTTKTSGGYVYYGDDPLIVGNPDETGDISSTVNNGTDTSYRDNGGGVGAGGGGGGGASTKTDDDEDKDKDVDTDNGDDNNNKTDETVTEIPDEISKELENHWGKDLIEELYRLGIITGDGNGLRLKDSITRAEFTALIVRALELEETEYQNTFKDVDKDDWYAPYIAAAYKLGLITGDGVNFRPLDTITREEICKIISSLTEADITSVEMPFGDIDLISPWALDSVKEAYSLGIVNGMDGNFAPKDNALREQAFAILARLLELL